MTRYVVRRLVGLVVVLLLVLTLVFFLLHAAPGGPEYAYLGVNPTPAKRAAVLNMLGLNRPLWSQYLHFVGSIARGDFGSSLTSGTPVGQLMLQRLPVTLELALLSFVVWVAIGMLLGMVAAARNGRLTDGFVKVGSVVALSIPSFWLGLVLVVLFGLWIPGVLPSSGWVAFSASPGGNLRAVILPAFTLGLVSAAVISRTLRASLIDQLGA
ncbi:MAG: ABC transporter permease, partial [Trebonia sp.]